MWLVIILVFVTIIVFAVIYYCACRNTGDKKEEKYSAAATETPKSKDIDDGVQKSASMS